MTIFAQNTSGISFNFISFDLSTDEMRVQLRLGNQKVQLSSLSSSFSLLFFTLSLVQGLLLGLLTQITFLPFVTLPEAKHFSHTTSSLRLHVLLGFVGTNLPFFTLPHTQNRCLSQVCKLSLCGLLYHSVNLWCIFSRQILPYSEIDIIILSLDSL